MQSSSSGTTKDLCEQGEGDGHRDWSPSEALLSPCKLRGDGPSANEKVLAHHREGEGT